MFIFFLILGAILLVTFLTKRTAKVTLNVAFLKAVTSMCFILTGLLAFAENESCPRIVGVLVAAGGVWGLLGDIALDLKYVFKKYEGSYLTAGFSSFLVGHIFYSLAMFFAHGFNKFVMIFSVVSLLASFGFTFITEPLLKVRYKEFKPITCLYMAVIGFTVGMSFAYAIATDFDVGAVIMSAGLILFNLSDAVLAGIYFSLDPKKRTSRPSIILNHALYYVGQFMIAASMYFIQGVK